ncbi:MAG: peptidase U32 family protein [Bacillota bacterium]
MKVLAPASSAYEAGALISAGAEELFCGLHPGAWKSRHGGEVWLNRRGPGAANIESMEELKKLAETAHSRGVPVFLTLNLPFYHPDHYPEIISLAGGVIDSRSADALIIGDPGMILAVRESLPDAAIHVSSLAPVLNSSAASFFRVLGAARIIFPRYVDLEDIRVIMDKAGRDMEYEVFILNDGCVFEEGYCLASHAFGGAFCHRPWFYRLAGEEDGQASTAKEPFWHHLRDYQKWLWCVKNCGGGPGPGGHPLGMCGLCALPELHAMGVASVKIVGREAPLPRKIASVRLVRRVLDCVRAGQDPETVKRQAKKIRSTPHLCASGYMCYFR